MNKKTSYTITCHSPYNYGAVLQTYALNTKLITLGLDAKVIDYNPSYYFETKKGFFAKIARVIIRTPEWIKGERNFRGFINEYIPLSSSSYEKIDDLIDNPPCADYYFAGSDQIWNSMDLENGKDDAFFLTFAPEGKPRISYAASLAMPYIPEEQRSRYKDRLSKFDAISVREKTGQKLLTDLGVKDVKAVCDPVFLLTREEWIDKIASKAINKTKEKYVLIYSFLRNKALHEYARKLADDLGVKVYSVNTSIEDHFLDTDKYFWNVSPNDFVNLIRNAEAVVTNSFHGTSFSIIFNKPFHLFGKKDKANSRMLDLLEELGLSDRIVKDGVRVDNYIDYSEVNKKIEGKRSYSTSFLVNSINN